MQKHADQSMQTSRVPPGAAFVGQGQRCSQVHSSVPLVATMSPAGMVHVWSLERVEAGKALNHAPACAVAWAPGTLSSDQRGTSATADVAVLWVCAQSQVHAYLVPTPQHAGGPPLARAPGVLLAASLLMPETLACARELSLVAASEAAGARSATVTVTARSRGSMTVRTAHVSVEGEAVRGGGRAELVWLQEQAVLPALECDIVSVCSDRSGLLIAARGSPHDAAWLLDPRRPAGPVLASSAWPLTATVLEAASDQERASRHVAVAADGNLDARVLITAVMGSGGPSRLVFWRLDASGPVLHACCEQAVRLQRRPRVVAVVARDAARPAVAVGFDVAVSVWAQRDARWLCVSDMRTVGPVRALCCAGGRLYVATTAQLLITDLALQFEKAPVNLGAIVAAAKAPLPPWHPRVLVALMLRGAHGAALAALKELAALVRGLRAAPDTEALSASILGGAPDILLLAAAAATLRERSAMAPPVTPSGMRHETSLFSIGLR
jgi:hypothetical protein